MGAWGKCYNKPIATIGVERDGRTFDWQSKGRGFESPPAPPKKIIPHQNLEAFFELSFNSDGGLVTPLDQHSST